LQNFIFISGPVPIFIAVTVAAFGN